MIICTSFLVMTSISYKVLLNKNYIWIFMSSGYKDYYFRYIFWWVHPWSDEHLAQTAFNHIVYISIHSLISQMCNLNGNSDDVLEHSRKFVLLSGSSFDIIICTLTIVLQKNWNYIPKCWQVILEMTAISFLSFLGLNVKNLMSSVCVYMC